MAEIEVGDVIIVEPLPLYIGVDKEETIRWVTKNREVRADFRFSGDGSAGTANFGLLMEYHPELEEHCDAIRHYMKQQARMVLGNGDV